jgi:hypothetical protein
MARKRRMSASSIFTSMRGHRQSSAAYGRLTAGSRDTESLDRLTFCVAARLLRSPGAVKHWCEPNAEESVGVRAAVYSAIERAAL